MQLRGDDQVGAKSPGKKWCLDFKTPEARAHSVSLRAWLQILTCTMRQLERRQKVVLLPVHRRINTRNGNPELVASERLCATTLTFQVLAGWESETKSDGLEASCMCESMARICGKQAGSLSSIHETCARMPPTLKEATALNHPPNPGKDFGNLKNLTILHRHTAKGADAAVESTTTEESSWLGSKDPDRGNVSQQGLLVVLSRCPKNQLGSWDWDCASPSWRVLLMHSKSAPHHRPPNPTNHPFLSCGAWIPLDIPSFLVGLGNGRIETYTFHFCCLGGPPRANPYTVNPLGIPSFLVGPGSFLWGLETSESRLILLTFAAWGPL